MNGHCTFNPNGSTQAIDNLRVNGCITGVSYVSPGIYQVSLSSPPAEYGVIGSASADTAWPIATVYPSSSQTPTGFQFVTVAMTPGDPATDFARVTIQVL